MSDVIKASDILDESLFSKAQSDGEKFNELVETLTDSLKNLLEISSKSISLNTIQNVEDLKRYNKDMQDSLVTEQAYLKVQESKLNIQIKNEKAAQSAIRTSKLKEAQIDKETKATQRSIKEQEKANSVFQQTKTRLEAIKKQLKDLEIAGKGQEESTKAIRKEYEELNAKVRSAEQSVGEFQRNVGNYPNVNERYAVSLGKLSKGLRGLGGLGKIVSEALGVDPAAAEALEDAARTLKEVHHVEGLENAVKKEGTVATEAHTVAVEAETTAMEEESAVSNIALGLWGLLAVGIAAAAYAIYQWTKAVDDDTDSWIKNNEVIKESKRHKEELIKQGKTLAIEQGKASGMYTDAEAETIAIINQLDEKKVELKKKLNDEYAKNQGTFYENMEEKEREALTKTDKMNIELNEKIKSARNSIWYLDGDKEEEARLIAIRKKKFDAVKKALIDEYLYEKNLADVKIKMIEDAEKKEKKQDQKKEEVHDYSFEIMQEKIKLQQAETADKKKQLDLQLEYDLNANSQEAKNDELAAIKGAEIRAKYNKAVEALEEEHNGKMIDMAKQREEQMQRFKEGQATTRTAMKTDLLNSGASEDEIKSKMRDQEIEDLKKDIALENALDQKSTDDKLRLAELEYEKKKELHDKTMAQIKQEAEATINFTQEALERKNDMINKQLDGEMQVTQDAVMQQQQLAIAGRQNVLAYEQAQLAKEALAKQKQAIAEKKQASEIAFLKLLASAAEKEDPAAALATALVEMGIAKAIGGSFIEGTENVAKDLKGNKVHNGTDGYLIAVDGRERILNPEQNKMIGSLTNDELAQLAMFHQMGYIPSYMTSQGDFATNVQTSLLVGQFVSLKQEISELKEIVRSRPVSSINLNNLGEVVETKISNGLKRITTHKNNRNMI